MGRNEYYFGYGHNNSDLTLQDFRSRDDWWDYTRYALEFFQESEIPFWQMQNDNEISSASNDYGFYKSGESYTVYLKNGGTTDLDLSGTTGSYDVRWFDPRNGGPLQLGSVSQVTGGGSANLGQAPNNTSQDWAILVQRRASNGPNQPPTVSIPVADPALASGDGVYQEQNGLVIIEMESQPAAGGWQEQTSVAGYTGDGYYRWEGPDLFGSAGAQGVTAYKINVTNAGTYQMRFRNHRDSDIPFDQENDVWARMDNGSWAKVFSGTQGSWNWGSNFDFGEGNRPSASYQLSAGEHTFYISGRSNGFRLDRVAFYNTALTSAGVAQDVNTPESPTSGVVDGMTFNLEGQVSDDGQVLPSPSLQWSLDAGPGTAAFSDPMSRNTQVTFSQAGLYRVKLTANDGEYETSSMRVIVTPAVELPSEEVTFTPIDDATVQGTTGINDAVIKVQTSGPSRVGYFKFEVTGLTPAEIGSAKLLLTVSQDAGSGRLNLKSGSTNAWTEETISGATAPAAGAVIDSVDGTHGIGQVLDFNLDAAVTDSGQYTFVLQHSGGNDVWFSSKEGGAAPQLVITRPNNSLPGDYNRDEVVNNIDRVYWRFSYGSKIGNGLQADGNRDGIVDAADYTIWRDAMSQPAAAQASVPSAPATAAAIASARVASADAPAPATRYSTPRESSLPAAGPIASVHSETTPAARSRAGGGVARGADDSALLLIVPSAAESRVTSASDALAGEAQEEVTENSLDEAFAGLSAGL